MEYLYFLYRHIRLDKDEPFYIGIGRIRSDYKIPDYTYKRAYSKRNRSRFWRSIVAKTAYEVDILLETNNLDFLKEKEIEFIALYGRRDLGKGPLVNLTDGGEGAFGHIKSKETREKLSIALKNSFEKPGRREAHRLTAIEYAPNRGKKGPDATNAKTVYCYDLNGNFIEKIYNIRLVKEKYGVMANHVSSCIHNKRNSCGNYMWFDTYKGDKIAPYINGKSVNKFKPVLMLDKISGNFIKEFNSLKEASLFSKAGQPCISSCCRGRKNSAGGYKWMYKKDYND